MHLGSTITTIGFWLGTLLPVAYLPVIVIGIDSVTRLALFLGLVTVNVLALVVGHDYPGPGAGPGPGPGSDSDRDADIDTARSNRARRSVEERE